MQKYANASVGENNSLCMLSYLLQACYRCDGDFWLEVNDTVPPSPDCRGIQSTGYTADPPYWPTSQTHQAELKAAIASPIGHHHVMIREARI
jgi:hypothetical protein